VGLSAIFGFTAVAAVVMAPLFDNGDLTAADQEG
jgi:hypothetical protein